MHEAHAIREGGGGDHKRGRRGGSFTVNWGKGAVFKLEKLPADVYSVVVEFVGACQAARVLLQTACPAPCSPKGEGMWKPYMSREEWLSVAMSPSVWPSTAVLLGRAPASLLEDALRAPASGVRRSWARVVRASLRHGRADLLDVMVRYKKLEALEALTLFGTESASTRRTTLLFLQTYITSCEFGEHTRAASLLRIASGRSLTQFVDLMLGGLSGATLLQLASRDHRAFGCHPVCLVRAVARRGLLSALPTDGLVGERVIRTMAMALVDSHLDPSVRVDVGAWASDADRLGDLVELVLDEARSFPSVGDWPPGLFALVQGWVSLCSGYISGSRMAFWRSIRHESSRIVEAM